MRRLGSVLITLILIPSISAGAQSLVVGGKLGRNVTQFVGEFGTRENPFDSRLGIAAGAVVAIHFGKILALQTEALYTVKGAAGPDPFDMRIAYLEIPVLLRLTAPIATSLRMNVAAGVAPALEVSCGGWTEPAHIPELPPPPPVPLDCADMRTDRSDFGLVIGTGADIVLPGVTLTVEARYTHGTSDIGSGFRFVTVKNRAFSLYLGLSRRLLE